MIFSETLTLQSHMLFNTVCMSQRCRRFMLLTGHFPTWFLVFCTCSTIHKPLSRLDSVEFKRTPSGGLSQCEHEKNLLRHCWRQFCLWCCFTPQKESRSALQNGKNRLQPGEWQMPNRLSSPATSTPSY